MTQSNFSKIKIFYWVIILSPKMLTQCNKLHLIKNCGRNIQVSTLTMILQ